MGNDEIVVLLVSIGLTGIFLSRWYRRLATSWRPRRGILTKCVFGVLPIAALAVILYTLRVLAAIDVIDDFIYILLYLLLGFAWIYIGMSLTSGCLDLSWTDDGINLNNPAAVIAVAAAFLAHTVIYSGANIGDGPGWWCVVFAGGLGLAAWLILGFAVEKTTHAFERVTIGRDVDTGVRLGAYLLASGIILGRASAGDWTSFAMTVVEFAAGWPVLLLTALMIAVERYYVSKSHAAFKTDERYLLGSLFWAVVYIGGAVASVLLLLPPLA
ncbi:MAG: hypothetical protein LBN02_01500 [Oscillospiraceae bacterium]|jgi:hypothetical protein|nr:hypothetical protein [Oscillospiraceae bacterium]